MTIRDFFDELQAATTVRQVEDCLSRFESENANTLSWVPVGGRDNNRGAIEVSADPGRSVVERLTNGIDAVLEAEHGRHGGLPDCRSPKEGATAWLNVPEAGLSEMTPGHRRLLAQRVTVHLLEGEGRDSRTIDMSETVGPGCGRKEPAGHYPESECQQQTAEALPRGDIRAGGLQHICSLQVHPELLPGMTNIRSSDLRWFDF